LLEKYRPADHPRLLAGVTDDAAVYQIDEETAVVQTVDFFPPVVDDPWTYGAIAAANAMSDVYAMGAEVALCLNVAGFPEDMSPDVIGAVLMGGADKVNEAGGIIAGGHTIIDAEPKYGLSVMGLVHPRDLMTKTGARAGDALVLTKALGTGLILTAAKRDIADPAHLQAAVDSMLLLNRHASHVAREAGARALTDVTGFALTGHALEVADHSGVQLAIRASSLPILPGALEYAMSGLEFGGQNRNRNQLASRVQLDASLSEAMQRLVFDPQTSGGLLMVLPPENAARVVGALRSDGYAVALIGEVRAGSGVVIEA
jgi:selenide,water dikinase